MIEVTLDIETIPSQEKWVGDHINEQIKHDLQNIKVPKTIKKQETIDAHILKATKEIENSFDERLQKLAFNGASNHIISIGFKINESDSVCHFITSLENEKSNIESFFSMVDGLLNSGQDQRLNIIGHNIIGFDLKVIKQRCFVLGIKLPYWFPRNVKPWGDEVFDTMTQWGDAKEYIKLDFLAKALCISPKQGVDGSMVYKMWQDGNHEEIAEYCKNDVDMTYEVYKRMK